VRLSPAGKKKVLILENADRMQESARNAFLKVLEEPPADAVFILTTARRGAIMPTILSRVRTYAFVDRDLPAQAEVITRVFHDSPSDGESLQSYFYRFLPVSAATIDDAARRYVRKVLVDAMDEGKKPLEALPAAIGSGGEPIGPQGAVALLNKCKPGILYRLFLTRIAHYMRVALRSGAADREAAVFAAWTRSIREALDASEVYNIAPASALESLAQAMKESL
jgi:DNA polymerase-3 subunit gamma/tau